MQESDHQKFTDPLTGLGNRRMFNRVLADIFKTENTIADFAVLVVDLDPAGRLISREVAANAAKVLRSALPSKARLCRFDGLRFGILYLEADTETVRNVGQHAHKALMHYSSGISAVHRGAMAPPSVGICMLSRATDAFDLVSLAERVMREGQQTGTDVSFYTPSGFHGQARNLSLYGKQR